MRRPRAWRITMWTGLAATVLLAGGAIGSRRILAYVPCGSRLMVGLEGGSFVCGGDSGIVSAMFLSGYKRSLQWWSYTPWPGGWSLDFSLWLPAGATFAVSGLSAFMVCRTRRRPGHCPKCGYDRSGLPTDAPCPECGRA